MQDIQKKDHLLHGKNIEQMLLMRGLLKESQRGQIEQLLKQNTGNVFVELELKFNADQLSGQKENLQQQVAYSNKLAIEEFKQATFLYIYQGKKLSNLDIFKKYIRGSDMLLVFCEDSHMRSIKSKLDKLFTEENIGKRRIDLINHDAVLFNILVNAHSPQYSLTSGQELLFMQDRLKLKANKLPRIQLNDPLLLYYGFPPYSVITSRMCSDITAGYRTDYLYVIPQMNETFYHSHVILN